MYQDKMSIAINSMRRENESKSDNRTSLLIRHFGWPDGTTSKINFVTQSEIEAKNRLYEFLGDDIRNVGIELTGDIKNE